MDFTDKARNDIENQISHYLKTGEHHQKKPCTTLKFYNSDYTTNYKTLSTLTLSFDELTAVIIKDIDRNNYDGRGAECNLGNGIAGVDAVCLINFSFPQLSEKKLHKFSEVRIVGAWTHKSSEDITSLIYDWKNYKKYPNTSVNLKRRILSECVSCTSTLYIVDYNIIHSIRVVFPKRKN